MAYATRADMIARFGEQEIVDLTDRADPRAHVIDDAVLSRALDDADAEINSYIGQRYRVPLSPAPSSIVRVACDIARYRLQDGRATEEVRERYVDAVKWLVHVTIGSVVLINDDGVPLSSPTFTMLLKAATPSRTIRFDSEFDEDYSWA